MVDYKKLFKEALFYSSGGVGFCEGCNLVILRFDSWYDLETRLCFECAEYSESLASSSESESSELDSEIDDPTWYPPESFPIEIEDCHTPTESTDSSDSSDLSESD